MKEARCDEEGTVRAVQRRLIHCAASGREKGCRRGDGARLIQVPVPFFLIFHAFYIRAPDSPVRCRSVFSVKRGRNHIPHWWLSVVPRGLFEETSAELHPIPPIPSGKFHRPRRGLLPHSISSVTRITIREIEC